MAIHLTTLGTLRCMFNGTPTNLPRQRIRCALLILLACERQVTRARAAALLWPESDAKSARHALSQTLYALHRSYGDDWIVLDGDSMAATDRLSIDVASFERAARAGAFPLALRHYSGAFLDGSVRGPGPWMQWVEKKRREIEDLHHAIRADVERAHRPRMRIAVAAAVAFITLVLHAATPTLMPAAITEPDNTRYLVFPFESAGQTGQRVDAEPIDRTGRHIDAEQAKRTTQRFDAQRQVRGALMRRTQAPTVLIEAASHAAIQIGDLTAARRAARAAGAGRIITGRISRGGTGVVITAECTESFGAGRQVGRAAVTLRSPAADADSAWSVLVDALLQNSAAGAAR